MKIVQFVNVRWWNASAYYAVLQALGLQKKGHQVIIAGKRDSLPLKKAQEWGIPVYDEINLESTRPHITLEIFHKLPALIRDFQPDIMNPHRGENFPAIALISKKYDIPVVRTRGDARPPRKHIFSRIQNTRWTDFHILSLKKMIPHYRAIGVPENKIEVSYGAVHPDFEERKIFHNFQQAPLVFGMMARLAPIKGHAIALKAFARLVKEYPDTRFVIAGKEERLTYQDIKNIVSELGIEKYVELMGYLDNPWDFFRTVHVGISASYASEVICRICFEMMSQGIPMIASRWNVLEEIIEDRVNGLLFKPADPEDLYTKMKLLVENRELIQHLSENARQTVEKKFFLDVFTTQIESIFLQLTRGK